MFRKCLAAIAALVLAVTVHAEGPVGQPASQLQHRLNGITSTNSTPGTTLQASNITAFSTLVVGGTTNTGAAISSGIISGTTAVVSGLATVGTLTVGSSTPSFALNTNITTIGKPVSGVAYATNTIFITNGVIVGWSATTP